MTAIPDNKKTLLNKARKVLNRNLSTFNGQNQEEVIRELQNLCRSLVDSVTELQQLSLAARAVEPDGMPAHGARCEALDGQFLRLVQTTVAPAIITVEHGLERIPQGMIGIFTSSAVPKILTAGIPASGFPSATNEKVCIQLNGSIGDLNVVILY